MMQFLLCDKQVFGELQLTPLNFNKHHFLNGLVELITTVTSSADLFFFYYLNAGQAPLHDGRHLPRSRLR